MIILILVVKFWYFVIAFLQDDDEADTVGCCTLKVENVTREPPNKLKVFRFLIIFTLCYG